MKIAAVTEDGKTISRHFGQAPLYIVLDIKDGEVIHRETRDKAGHHSFSSDYSQTDNGEKHGFGARARSRHAGMAVTINDCNVCIAGGMGWGAYESLKGFNIEPFITDVENIDEAVSLYIKGKLVNRTERLH